MEGIGYQSAKKEGAPVSRSLSGVGFLRGYWPAGAPTLALFMGIFEANPPKRQEKKKSPLTPLS